MRSALFAAAALVASAAAWAPSCQTEKISINVTTAIAVTNFTTNPSTNDIVYLTQTEAAFNGATNATARYIQGMRNVSFEATIWTRLCVPAKEDVRANSSETVQFLIHGIGFDHTYWDGSNGAFTSYIDAATGAGYSTFSIDRLGIGGSSKPEGLKVQTSTQIAVVAALTSQLRSGQSIYGKKFTKVVHVGHSFGSIITNGLVAAMPSASDGIILTGYAHNASGVPTFIAGTALVSASKADSSRFSGLDPTYLLFNSEVGSQIVFFYTPNFVQSVLDQVYATRQTVTVGEILTLGAGIVPAPDFKGPVLEVTGEYDQIFCGGSCYAATPNIIAQDSKFFPAASTYQPYVVAGTGHAVNFQYAAKQTFQDIQKFLQSQSL